MFISYQYILTDSTYQYYDCTIVDTDFEETDSLEKPGYDSVADFIIETYEKRNLNVASNLVRWLMYEKAFSTKHHLDYIMRSISYSSEHFDRYKVDVEKLLLLL